VWTPDSRWAPGPPRRTVLVSAPAPGAAGQAALAALPTLKSPARARQALPGRHLLQQVLSLALRALVGAVGRLPEPPGLQRGLQRGHAPRVLGLRVLHAAARGARRLRLAALRRCAATATRISFPLFLLTSLFFPGFAGDAGGRAAILRRPTPARPCARRAPPPRAASGAPGHYRPHSTQGPPHTVAVLV